MKQEIIKKIIEFPERYSILMGVDKEGKWDEQKLEFLEIHRLNDVLRDLQTFKRNIERINGK